MAAVDRLPRRNVTLARRAACRVVGVGLGTEANCRVVNLGLGLDELREPRRAAEEQYKQSGRKRIECAEMPDAFFAVDAAHQMHDIVRRDSAGLSTRRRPSGP